MIRVLRTDGHGHTFPEPVSHHAGRGLGPETCTPNLAKRKTTRGFRVFELQDSANPCASAFDLLAHPDPALGDVRGHPYVERRRLMLELLQDVSPPIQAVPATDDRETALIWFQALQGQGIEGIVAKRGASPYRGGQRLWEKIRHSENVDADVIGFTGTVARPLLSGCPTGGPLPAADCATGRAGRPLPPSSRPGRRIPHAGR
ncbi:ATP-dependent DNA ligase [Streptomyces xanthophaeus]